MADRQELRGGEEKSGDGSYHNDTTGYRLSISVAWRSCRDTGRLRHGTEAECDASRRLVQQPNWITCRWKGINTVVQWKQRRRQNSGGGFPLYRCHRSPLTHPRKQFLALCSGLLAVIYPGSC